MTLSDNAGTGEQSVTQQFIESLPHLSLAEIRDSLEAKERELEAVIADHRKAIEALRYLERVVDLAQNGPKPRPSRKPRSPKTAATVAPPPSVPQQSVRSRAALYLSHNGATKFATLAQELNCATVSLYKLASDDPWFVKEGPCLALTATGQRAAA